MTDEGIKKLVKPWDWKDYIPATAEGIMRRRKLAARYDAVAVIFDSGDVTTRIAQLADIQAYRIGTSLDRPYIGVLHGVVPLMSEMGQQLADRHPNTCFLARYIHASRDGDKQTGKNAPTIYQDIPPTLIHDRHVTIVDEVLDEGLTIELLAERLSIVGMQDAARAIYKAASVGVVVLCDKGIYKPKAELFSHIDRGLMIPQVWGSGMGMDGLNEKDRFAPHIMVSRAQKREYRDRLVDLLDVLCDSAVLTIDDIIWVE